MRCWAVTIVIAVVVLALPGAARAAIVDLEVLSAQPSTDRVPVGVPTTVTWVLNVRNNGEATTGSTGSIGPVGPVAAFSPVRLQANNPGQDPGGEDYCDGVGGDAPRCRLPFLAASQTQVVELTDTVLAREVGPLTRTFTADVLEPDREGDIANNRLSVSLPAVPAPPVPTVSRVLVRGPDTLTPNQRRRAVGKLSLTLSRPAELRLRVARRDARGRYRFYGEWVRTGREGAQTLLLANRIGQRRGRPIDYRLRPLSAGRYRLTVIASADGQVSTPVRRGFVVR